MQDRNTFPQAPPYNTTPYVPAWEGKCTHLCKYGAHRDAASALPHDEDEEGAAAAGDGGCGRAVPLHNSFKKGRRRRSDGCQQQGRQRAPQQHARWLMDRKVPQND